MKLLKKIIPVFLSAAMTAAMLSGCGGGSAGSADDIHEMRDMTAEETIADMGIGINLGNTFEVSGMTFAEVQKYETGWGSPVITQEIIQGYADAGFGTLRIPVAWSNMMNVRTYEINPDYLARVKQVVEWALGTGMYVIMDIHWDGGWFSDFAKDDLRDKRFEKYESIWTQLSAAFGEYGDHLIFESLNEEGGWDDIWNRYSGEGDKQKSYDILNDINQRFVNIVRSSGENNSKRFLLIAGYNTDFDLTCDEMFRMPDDPASKCAVSVHYYTPSTFAILEEDASWGKARTDWGTDADIEELNKYMDMVKTRFVDNGIPVIIGEYGCPTKNKDPESVSLYISSVCEAAYSRGMCPVLWDITDLHYNRSTCEFNDKELLEKMMEIRDNGRNQ